LHLQNTGKNSTKSSDLKLKATPDFFNDVTFEVMLLQLIDHLSLEHLLNLRQIPATANDPYSNMSPRHVPTFMRPSAMCPLHTSVPAHTAPGPRVP